MFILKALSIAFVLLTSNVSLASLDSTALMSITAEVRSAKRDLLSDKKLHFSDREARLLAEKNLALKEKEGLQEVKETANLDYSKASSIYEYKSLLEQKELSKEEFIKLSENNNSVKDYVFNDKLKEELSNKDFYNEMKFGNKIDVKTFDGNNFTGVIPQIPEPETYMMLLVGLMLLGLTHKKNRKRKFNSMY